MARLRLRVASTGATHKVEIPNGCTWHVLQHEVRNATGISGDADIVLSLNKKTPLSAKPEDPVATLGICNGDLVWLLSPDPPGAMETARAEGPTGTCASRAFDARAPPSIIDAHINVISIPSSRDGSTSNWSVENTNKVNDSLPTPSMAPLNAGQPAGGTSQAGPSHNRSNAGDKSNAGGRHLAGGGNTGKEGPDLMAGIVAADGTRGAGETGGADDPMDVSKRGTEEGGGAEGGAAEAGALEEEEEQEDGLATMGPPGLSLRLRRLLTPLPPDLATAAAAGCGSTAAAASTVVQATNSKVNDSGAGGGDGGPPPCVWTRLSPACRCLLVVDCAMAEAGFQGLQDLPALALRMGASGAARQYCGGGGAAGFPRMLLYGSSYISGSQSASSASGDGKAAGSSGTGAAVAAVATAAVALAASSATVPADVAMEDDASAAAGGSGGSSAQQSTTPAGCTPASQLAAAPPPAVVKLAWYGMGRYLVLHGLPYGVAASAATGAMAPAAAATTTLFVDLAEYGAQPAAAAAGGSGLPQPQPRCTVLLLPADAAGTWRRLKDQLALPLLAAACRTASVPPPLGLTVLPLELQVAVLRRLQARDLAALSCVSTGLHRLASEDELWRPLYEQEFGSGGGGGGPAFDVALANNRGYKFVFGRRWAERAERRKRRQVFRPQLPTWGPPPMAPHRWPPFMPPGSIGGDYDRLPGPLMGGLPGSLGGWGGRMPGPPGPLLFGGGGGPGGPLSGPQGGLPGLMGRRPGAWGSSGGGGFGGFM